ncbi:unnamed protein product [Rotaria sp. Silwood1]|nr:unnamed protein product [Rotaria sp. Silwood1]
MASDNDYDIFDYNSNQDSFDIDYQIDLFELGQCLKSRKSKRKLKKSSHSISLKALKSQPKPVKLSSQDHPNIGISDIRLAPIDQSVQKDFMKTLNENISYSPDLIYHGTKSDNIKSILRYGFLIPSQAHPSDS